MGDKTTCGGEVKEADARVSMFGIAHAREGDRVSCGKDGKTYKIVGGVSFIDSHGRLVAGTLDSVSSCPCIAGLRHSFTAHSYESSRVSSLQASLAGAQPNTSATSDFVGWYPSGAITARNSPPPKRSNDTPAAEPGFYIVPKSTTREQLESSLFTLRDPAVMGKFKLLNPNLGDVKAGSMIVLSDPDNYQCTRQEALLMDVAAKTNRIIETLSPEEADFLARHRDTIQAFLGYSSNAIGVGASIFKNNLDNVGQAIKDLEALQQKTLQRDGNLRSPAFFAERQRLLVQLNTHMAALTRKSIGIPDHVNLKKALGISSQSLVHLWTETSPAGQIPGHATYLEGVAKASKYVQYGGWLGTAIGGGASALKVQDVCSAGKSEACERIKFTEAGSFSGGIMGGAAAGALLSIQTTGGLCLTLGVPTGGLGTGVCTAVAVTTGALVGGAVGTGIGEWLGEIIYEATK
jgi:uncharacterized Zn-binding protein involved in type VI secretion